MMVVAAAIGIPLLVVIAATALPPCELNVRVTDGWNCRNG